MCMTCVPDIKEGLGICIICAKTCHKDHEVVPGNFGISQKVVCDCGNYKIKKLKEKNYSESKREAKKDLN